MFELVEPLFFKLPPDIKLSVVGNTLPLVKHLDGSLVFFSDCGGLNPLLLLLCLLHVKLKVLILTHRWLRCPGQRSPWPLVTVGGDFDTALDREWVSFFLWPRDIWVTLPSLAVARVAISMDDEDLLLGVGCLALLFSLHT